MLARLQAVLHRAYRHGYAVGAFNISNLEQAQAVIQAAASERSPVILNTSEKAITYAGLDILSGMIKQLASQTSVPVVLNLDHGHDPRTALQCLGVGYTGIMFDGSRLPYGRNVRWTAAIVQAGKKRNVGVEGELGRVLYPGEKATRAERMTNPAEATDFVRTTGVCAFAVSIGNSHGVPQKNEQLDFALLRTIRQHVRVPLVLHGASGTPAPAVRRAIKLGIAKINIDTDLRLAFTGELRTFLKKNPKTIDPREYLGAARASVQKEVVRHMRLFGSSGRAR